MTDYKRGQQDLIEHIKREVEDIASNSSSDNMPLDLMNLLMRLEASEDDIKKN